MPMIPRTSIEAAPPETLKVRAMLERSTMRPGAREPMHLVVELVATGAPVDALRPSLSVVFVLDTSGSMGGRPLAQVIRSVERMADLLSANDKVGVVAFADDAAEVCPLRTLTDEARRSLKRRVARLTAGGGTALEAGLRRAQAMCGVRSAHERQVVLLLTDGCDGGDRADLIARAAQMRTDISISTLGYGDGHDVDLLNDVAQGGGGQYWYVGEPDEARVEFARALGAQSDIVVDGIELALCPREHVQVTDVLGAKVRFTHEGPAVELPDLRQHQSRFAVATLALSAPREPGRLDVIDVKIRFRTAGALGTHVVTKRVTIDVVDREPALIVEAHQVAQMARAETARSEARQAADRGNWDQAAAVLRTRIAALEAVPGYQLADGSPLSECVEQLIDEATEYETRPSAERYAKLKASQRGVEVAQGATHASSAATGSARSAALLRGASGPALPGFLIRRDGTGKPIDRVPLLSEMVVGRSPDNALRIDSRAVSRRHSKFSCRDGQLILTDLGTTNGTMLNGQRITASAVLQTGDTVTVGDVCFEVELPVIPPHDHALEAR